EDYEYRIYDRGLHYPAASSSMEYGPCPIVVMFRHEGFQYNEDLFVSTFRQSSGYESRKSIDRQQREDQV
ncbi:hypothetical protein BCR43DRAFT_421799, partial [Syncephalastrum racemosum]